MRDRKKKRVENVTTRKLHFCTNNLAQNVTQLLWIILPLDKIKMGNTKSESNLYVSYEFKAMYGKNLIFTEALQPNLIVYA